VKRVYPSRRFLPLLAAGCGLAFLPIFYPEGFLICALFNFVLLSMATADFLMTRPVEAENLSIEAPEEIGVGRTGILRLQWAVPSPHPMRTQVEIKIGDALESERTFWDLITRGAAPAVVETTVRAIKRGAVRVGGGRLRHRSRLGLWVLERPITAQQEVNVVPDLEDLKSREFLIGPRMFQIQGFKAVRRPEKEGEFDSLSKYTPGMDLRKIDWKASAKNRRLLSRTFTLEQNHHVYLAMDLGRLMGTRTAGLTKLDWALNAALKLGYLALRTGDNVGLLGFSDDLDEFLRSSKAAAFTSGGLHRLRGPRLRNPPFGGVVLHLAAPPRPLRGVPGHGTFGPHHDAPRRPA
jgi:uncharacterized protein (DUF58 family)